MKGTYSEYINMQKKKNLDFFFGKNNYKFHSNKYFTFKRILDEDTIIIMTNNIKIVNGSYLLMVDKNKGIFLKDWQVKKVSNYDTKVNSYLVKLNKNYMKEYEFNREFKNIHIFKRYVFDDFKELAEKQEKFNMRVKEGWIKK